MIARLPDGRQAWRWRRPTTRSSAAMGDIDIPGLVGGTVVVEAGEPRYRLAER